MASEMLDRMCAAAWNAVELRNPGSGTWADLDDEGKEYVRVNMAEVAKAMREPTEAMRDRYNDPAVVGYGPDGSDHDKVWQAGIDAVLAP